MPTIMIRISQNLLNLQFVHLQYTSHLIAVRQVCSSTQMLLIISVRSLYAHTHKSVMYVIALWKDAVCEVGASM